MPSNVITDTDDLDPLERQDQQDEKDAPEDDLILNVDEIGLLNHDEATLEESLANPTANILSAEVEKELDQTIAGQEIPEAGAPKKSHLLPQNLIDEPLRPEDLWDDDGTI